jgi:hypothetical protein
LLLPQLGLALTNHFLVLRAVWFALQSTLLVLVGLALAAWIGGRAGLTAGLLLPALVGSAPAHLGLQWGQAHLLVFALCLAALVAFERGRAPLGGLLLAAATLFKIFPGLLVLDLLARRRWRDLAWTLVAGAAITLLALAVVGVAPFREFVRYQLPRISSGAAFAFFRGDWRTVSSNFSVGGIAFKLEVLGVPGMTARLASTIGWVYSLALLALLAHAVRQPPGDRLARATLWLGLLNLASLRSPLAPSGYVTVGVLWLLTLLAARARRKRDVAAIVLLYFLIPGIPPLPSAAVDIALRLLGQAAMILLSLYAVWRPRLATEAALGAPLPDAHALERRRDVS